MARDLVRMVQQARKDEGLQVTDRIKLTLLLPPELAEGIDPHMKWMSDQVLATSTEVTVADSGVGSDTSALLPHGGKIDGHTVSLSVTATE
jgi:isoleucyl-tRNA synthetase